MLYPGNLMLERFIAESVFSFIVVLLSFLIYYQTREIYSLTKHRGIFYFRNTFLLFGLAYLTRFIISLAMLNMIAIDFVMPRQMFFPLMIVPVGYLSTLALFFLAYSTVWKNFKAKNSEKIFLWGFNLAAVIVAVVSMLYRSPFLMSLIQMGLMVFILLSFAVGKKKTKKTHITKMSIFYYLLIAFWILNMFTLSPGRYMSHDIRITIQIFSSLIFIVLYFKVKKWIK